MDVLKRIEELRKIKNITVYELAKRCGIARNTIYSWYSKNYQPTFSTLELICEKGFGITIQEFLGINEKTAPLSQEQINLLNQWALLTEKQKASILEIIENYLNK